MSERLSPLELAVLEFKRKHGLHEQPMRQMGVLLEEISEVAHAYERLDSAKFFHHRESHDVRQARAQLADALGDTLYVLIGMFLSSDVPMLPVFYEIHRSNMTKTPLRASDGKGGKGAGYEPPRLEELLYGTDEG